MTQTQSSARSLSLSQVLVVIGAVLVISAISAGLFITATNPPQLVEAERYVQCARVIGGSATPHWEIVSQKQCH